MVGVFGYSDEDGTEAAGHPGKLDEDEVRARTEHVTSLVEELTSRRAAERVGSHVEVLVESLDPDAAWQAEGRAAHQGPEVDGCTTLTGPTAGIRIGDIVPAVVTASVGADLVAEPC